MAELCFNGSGLGTELRRLLMGDDICPGSSAGYQLCKTIFLFHPLGQKMASAPIALAQSQSREISVPNSPEKRVREAFLEEWKNLNADRHIFNAAQTARIYGEAAIIFGSPGIDSNQNIPLTDLANIEMFFNVLDPLTTAGSGISSQNPNSSDFMKTKEITVQGQTYHRSRSCIVLNEEPIFLSYTDSSFGFTGRSVYQRALFPLKSFVQTMIADDMVARKVGVLVTKQKTPGSAVDGVMKLLSGIKRNVLKEAENNNVITIDITDSIETIDMQHVGSALETARKNILINTAVAADMPAQLLNQETFAEGFGEGSEDAKNIARYIDRIRIELNPIYSFFDTICMYRAWNENFYKAVQADHHEYKDVPYKQAFYDWKNSFMAEWPSLLIEPDSEKIKVEDTKLKAVIAAAEVLLPMMDPDNKAQLISWVADCFNENKMLFPTPLLLDIEALRDYIPPTAENMSGATELEEPSEPKPFSGEA
jgi:hypothetical protein